VIWDITNQDQVDGKELENEKISVWIAESTCTVSMSMPTGENNYALHDAFKGNSGSSIGA